MLSQLLVHALRERFPHRGLVTGERPEPCVVFPGIHIGIRRVAIYDDGEELTVSIDDLTHGHFAEYGEGLSETEKADRIVSSVVEFLDALFADRVVVWGQSNGGGGWYRADFGESRGGPGVREFVWSGPRSEAR